MTTSGYLTALASGFLFGLGLAVSHMVDPAKVLGFLDIAGNWDPSLGFVLGGAGVVFFVAWRFSAGRARPLLAAAFSWPQRTAIFMVTAGATVFAVRHVVGS